MLKCAACGRNCERDCYMNDRGVLRCGDCWVKQPRPRQAQAGAQAQAEAQPVPPPSSHDSENR